MQLPDGGNDDKEDALTVEVIKNEVRLELLRPLKLLRTPSYQYLNVEEESLTNAYFVSDFELNSAFLWTAFCGKYDQLMYLEALGADINFVSPKNNFNALHTSALSGSAECVQWLLGKGCRIISTTDGYSPLYFGILARSSRICRYLVDAGCEIDATALHAAVRANSFECLQYLLLLKVPVNMYDESGFTALHIASDIGSSNILKLLLSDKRIDLNFKTRDSFQYTPLHLAAENGYSECVRLLLENGARVDELSSKNQTPLYLACRHNFIDSVIYLLEYKAQVNIQDIENRTPLVAALSKSPYTLNIVKRLVDHDADVNIADDFGYTALHIAALNELEDCVEFLIIKGANVAAKTRGNVTALNIMNRKTPTMSCKINDRLSLQLAYTEAQTLKFNFRDFVKNSTVGEIGYLYTLVKEGQSEILEHPLCQGFLHLKWEKIKIFIFIRALIGLFTVTMLSVYVLFAITENCYNAGQSTNNTYAMDSNEPDNTIILNNTIFMMRNFSLRTHFAVSSNDSIMLSNDLSLDESDDTEKCKPSSVGRLLSMHPDALHNVWHVVLGLLALNFIRTIFTLAAYRSIRHYLSKYSNQLEIIVTLCTLSLVYRDIDDQTYPWQKPVGAITILVSWAYAMSMIAQLPSVGTYISMFKKVLKEFLKMITAFICLLVGFSFTFCVLKEDDFGPPFIAFTRTIGMMTGELNLDDLLGDSDFEKTNISLKLTTMILLGLFIIIITIVLMNLLVGIAVNDVEGLRKTADLNKLIQQTKMIHFMEKTCFKGFFPPRLMEILKSFMYKWPNSYTVVIYVRPLSPHEKRLPKDVMEEGLKLALERTRKRNAEKNRKPSTDERINKLEERIIKLQDTISTMKTSVQIILENAIRS